MITARPRFLGSLDQVVDGACAEHFYVFGCDLADERGIVAVIIFDIRPDLYFFSTELMAGSHAGKGTA